MCIFERWRETQVQRTENEVQCSLGFTDLYNELRELYMYLYQRCNCKATLGVSAKIRLKRVIKKLFIASYINFFLKKVAWNFD